MAKDIFQVHCVSVTGRKIINKKIERAKLIAFFETLPRCVVGMEACATSQYWAREISKHGHDVRLIAHVSSSFATHRPQGLLMISSPTRFPEACATV